MGIGSFHSREHFQERQLSWLLGRYRETEVSTRRLSWGDKAEVIMRRGADIGRAFFCYPYLDRGIQQAHILIEEKEEQGIAFTHGSVILAREMGKSRGRFGRAWYAPSGGAWLTLVVSPTFLPENRQFYSLILAVACCEVIRDYGAMVNIKWVNDIHLQGRKMAGMLIESYTSRTLEQEYLLLGIGVNVNNSLFPACLRPIGVSLKEATGKEVPLEKFVALLLAKIGWYIGLMDHFEQEYLESLYEPTKPVNPLIEQWKRYSDTPGRRVLYGFNVYDQPLYEAVALDIDDTGALILYHETEKVVVKESSGEVIYLN